MARVTFAGTQCFRRGSGVSDGLADTIGAGDSFMAGLLAALADRDLLGRANGARLHALSRTELGEVLGFAAACAAMTVGRPGADPPRRIHFQPA